MRFFHRAAVACCLGFLGFLGIAVGIAGSADALPSLPGPSSDAEPPDELSARIADGGRALARGDLQAAQSLFEDARRAAPEHALPLLGLSEVHERRGDSLEALELARRAKAADPDLVEATRRVARLLVRVGAPAEALEAFADLRRLRPDDPGGYVPAALVLRKIEKVDEAVDLLRQALDRGIRAPTVDEQLAFLELTRGRIDAARKAAETGLARFPDHGPLVLARGLALAADPDARADAVPELRRALELVPEPGRARLELGTLLGELAENGCSEEGIEHLRAARDLLPESADAHFRLGNALRACGDLEGARAALGRFQELNRRAEAEDHGGRSTGAALNQVQEMAAEGRLSAALEALDALLTTNDASAKEGSAADDDRPWTLKAKILFSMDRPKEALEAAREASRIRPGRLENHYLEGLFLSRSGRLEEARAALDRAAALDAEHGPTQALLGAVLGELGELDQAARHFEAALALDSTNPSLRLAYARLLAALGRAEESERQMEVYRALGGG